MPCGLEPNSVYCLWDFYPRFNKKMSIFWGTSLRKIKEREAQGDKASNDVYLSRAVCKAPQIGNNIDLMCV